MPPFFIMEYIKIKVRHVDYNSGDYYVKVSAAPAPKQPELWIFNDGTGGAIIFPDRITAYIGTTNLDSIEILEEAPKVEQATKSQTVDSNTLLKAIAIAQDPTLALNLIKD